MHKHDSCNCGHDHGEAHSLIGKFWGRLIMVLFFIAASFFLLRPFIVRQLLSRASSYMTYELYGDAARIYKKAAVIDRRNSYVWNMLGYSHQAGGNSEEALQAYEMAIGINYNDQVALIGASVILIKQKKYDEAVTYLERVRSLGVGARGLGAVDTLGYRKSALTMLANCYGILRKEDKRNDCLEELRRRYGNE